MNTTVSYMVRKKPKRKNAIISCGFANIDTHQQDDVDTNNSDSLGANTEPGQNVTEQHD